MLLSRIGSDVTTRVASRAILALSVMAIVVADPFTLRVQAQETSTPGAAQIGPDETAIRRSAEDFVAAFKRHDAKAIAAMWTEHGEYVDEVGRKYEGRKAIEQEYEKFFQSHPRSELQVNIDSVRIITPTIAIEDGTAALEPPPAGTPVRSKYIAVHAKQDDGKWLLASVRDSRVNVPTTYGHLEELEPLVGEWTAEHAGTRADITCQWNPNKSFLERRFVVTRDGDLVSSSIEIIGWDPITEQITSWTFSMDGGRAVGAWTALADGWSVQNAGVTADGRRTHSTDAWAPLLDGALGWRSTQRSIDGVPLKDVRHVVFKKKTTQKPTESD